MHLHPANGQFQHWTGDYQGIPVKDALPVADGFLLLLDPDASEARRFHNLVRVSSEGRLLWTAPLPTDPDTFVAIRVEGDCAVAQTWSGFNMQLDLKTGQALRQEFVK